MLAREEAYDKAAAALVQKARGGVTQLLTRRPRESG